jgi:AcrR family transcriptional regulator
MTAATAKPNAAARILSAAFELFYRSGIRAVGVEQIVTHAGVTKPSLYRAYPSKDELAACYLREYGDMFWARFNEARAAHPGDPRAQVLTYLRGVGGRAAASGYRGCGVSNAAVEYPEADHPVRVVSEAHKRELRALLHEMAAGMGATDPQALGDGLLLMMEGVFISGQIFGEDGPAARAAENAERLIDAWTAKP